ncbi:hypothetical protein GGX14DRAFT_564931 [Mycena pura]|uniref:Uncharacterized protein n=1 Tax=Mycena pura TaxID=153505 RepID=A0AAD6VJS3_9AGAR|nr:hypothetical protein GGX14DRAFT_564931 [Mycena pura]
MVDNRRMPPGRCRPFSKAPQERQAWPLKVAEAERRVHEDEERTKALGYARDVLAHRRRASSFPAPTTALANTRRSDHYHRFHRRRQASALRCAHDALAVLPAAAARLNCFPALACNLSPPPLPPPPPPPPSPEYGVLTKQCIVEMAENSKKREADGIADMDDIKLHTSDGMQAYIESMLEVDSATRNKAFQWKKHLVGSLSYHLTLLEALPGGRAQHSAPSFLRHKPCVIHPKSAAHPNKWTTGVDVAPGKSQKKQRGAGGADLEAGAGATVPGRDEPRGDGVGLEDQDGGRIMPRREKKRALRMVLCEIRFRGVTFHFSSRREPRVQDHEQKKRR